MKPLHFALIFLTLIVSCGTKEELTPFTSVQTTAQAQGVDPNLTIVNGNFTFDEIDIDNPIGKLPIPLLGNFVQDLAGVFADIFVILSDNWEVDQEAQFIEIPEIDEEYIVGLQLTKLEFRIVPTNDDRRRGMFGRISEIISNRKAKLDFIEKIEIYAATEKMLAEDKSVLLAWYYFDELKLGKCLKQCIKLDIKRDPQGGVANLVPYLVGQTKLYLFPKVKINKTPKTKIKLKGEVDFRVKVKLPF